MTVRRAMETVLLMSISLVVFGLCAALWSYSTLKLYEVPSPPSSITTPQVTPWILNWLTFSLIILGAGALVRINDAIHVLRKLGQLPRFFFDGWMGSHEMESDLTVTGSAITVAQSIDFLRRRIRGTSFLLLLTVIVLRLFTPVHIGWGALALVGLLLAKLIGIFLKHSEMSFLAVQLPAFNYPIPTRGRKASATKAFHRGLAGFARLILVTPALFLLVRLADDTDLVQASLRNQAFSEAHRVLHAGALLATTSPWTTAALLALLPLGIVHLAYRLTHHWLASEALHWDFPHDVPPALYLRTWAADDLPMRIRSGGGSVLDRIGPPRRSNLTESVARNLSLIAPVALIAEPGSTSRQQGAGSLWATDDSWQQLVGRYASKSIVTTLVATPPAPGSGFAWEIGMVGSGDTTWRVAVVFPPGVTVSDAYAAGGFLEEASQLPLFDGVYEAGVNDNTILMARSRDTSWVRYDASERTDSEYALAFSYMSSELGAQWETDLLGAPEAVGPLSVLAAQRDITRYSYEFPYSATALRTLMPVLLPIFHFFLKYEWLVNRMGYTLNERPPQKSESPE